MFFFFSLLVDLVWTKSILTVLKAEVLNLVYVECNTECKEGKHCSLGKGQAVNSRRWIFNDQLQTYELWSIISTVIFSKFFTRPKEYWSIWITLFLQSVLMLVSLSSNVCEPLSVSRIFIFGSSLSLQTRNLWIFCLNIPEFFATKIGHRMSILHIQEI